MACHTSFHYPCGVRKQAVWAGEGVELFLSYRAPGKRERISFRTRLRVQTYPKTKSTSIREALTRLCHVYLNRQCPCSIQYNTMRCYQEQVKIAVFMFQVSIGFVDHSARFVSVVPRT